MNSVLRTQMLAKTTNSSGSSEEGGAGLLSSMGSVCLHSRDCLLQGHSLNSGSKAAIALAVQWSLAASSCEAGGRRLGLHLPTDVKTGNTGQIWKERGAE